MERDVVRVTLVIALAALGFLTGKWAKPLVNDEAPEVLRVDSGNSWHVSKSAVTALDVLKWSEDLPQPAFDLRLAEALETMPIANLRSLAQHYREIAWRQYGFSVFAGYDRVHDALIRRAPWIAVEDLLAGAEWERAILHDDDDDLDLEGLLSTALASLYESEPERVLDVFRNVESRWVLEWTSIFHKLEGDGLLKAIAAAKESPAGQALEEADPNFFESQLLEAWDRVLRQLAKEDPQAALEGALAETDQGVRAAKILQVLNATSNPVLIAKQMLASGVLHISQLGRFLPDEAISWARARPEGDEKAISAAKGAAMGILNSSSADRFDRAHAILQEFLGESEATLFNEQYWEYRQPTDLASLKSLPRSDGGTRGFESWVDAEEDPNIFREVASATDILSDLPPTTSGTQRSSRFAWRWAGLPGEGKLASEWANQMLATGVRFRAVGSAVSAWAENEAAAAATWSVSLQPLELRAEALNNSIGELQKTDMEMARQLLRRSQLPDEIVKRHNNLKTIGSK